PPFWPVIKEESHCTLGERQEEQASELVALVLPMAACIRIFSMRRSCMTNRERLAPEDAVNSDRTRPCGLRSAPPSQSHQPSSVTSTVTSTAAPEVTRITGTAFYGQRPSRPPKRPPDPELGVGRQCMSPGPLPASRVMRAVLPSKTRMCSEA